MKTAYCDRGGSERREGRRRPGRRVLSLLICCFSVVMSGWSLHASTNDVSGASTNLPTVTGRVVPPGREGARKAQVLYGFGKYAEAAEAYIAAAEDSTRKSQRDFRYNAAVALFKAGKYSEAAEIFGELLRFSPDSNGDSATGLGASLFRSAGSDEEQDAEKMTESERLIKEAGEAFKEALRADPENETARKNLAVAAGSWRDASDRARIARLMSRYGQTPPGQIAYEMLSSQRNINKQIEQAFTNDSPSRIRQLEAFARKQADNADLWVPLKGKIMEALAQQEGADQQLLANLDQLVETTRDNMLSAAEDLRNLDPVSYDSARVSEAAIYHFWKGIAMYSSLLREDLRRQTNAIALAMDLKEGASSDPFLLETEQTEAVELTDLFMERFTQAVPEEGTAQDPPQESAAGDAAPLPAGDGAGPAGSEITAETRKQVLDLASLAAAAQNSAMTHLSGQRTAEAVTAAKEAHRLLKEIEELLPKEQPKGGGESREQQSSQEQSQEQSEDQQQSEQKEEKNGEDESQSQPEQQPQQEEQPESAQEAGEEEQEPDEDTTPEDVKKLLKKALQREKEHEAEKRQRRRHIPLSPLDRDW